MKLTLVGLFCCFMLWSAAQTSPYFEVKLKPLNSIVRSSVLPFDSIYLMSENRTVLKVYTNSSKKDSSFIIPNVPIGRYLLQFFSTKFHVFPLLIVVCSKCANQFMFFYYSLDNGTNNQTFERVEVSPGYFGGKKELLNDFLKTLTKKERKIITKSADFKIHFYVTKEKIISDISIEPASLPEKVKQAIHKGLSNLTNWKPGILNGTIVDDDYVLKKANLVSN